MQKRNKYKRFLLIYQQIYFKGFGYGHPNGFNQFMLNPNWLDAAYYMSYACTDYFRPQAHTANYSKGKNGYNLKRMSVCTFTN